MLDPQIENLLKGLCAASSDGVLIRYNSIYHYFVLQQTAFYCPNNKLYVTLNQKGCHPLVEVDVFSCQVLEEREEDNSLK